MKRIFTANLIIYNNNKILLVKRSFGKDSGGLWSIPGGTKNEDETIKKTLIREIKEELGIRVAIYKKFKNYSYQNKNKNIEAYYFYNKIKEPIKLDRNELAAFKWFPVNNIPKKLAFNQKKVLKDFIVFIKDKAL